MLLTPLKRWRTLIGWPAAVLALGLCSTAVGTRWLGEQIEHEAQANFERNVNRVVEDVKRRFGVLSAGLKGRAAVHATPSRVSRSEFREYVEARNLQESFPGVRGFGHIERVPRNALAAFVAAERADDAADFALHELAPSSHDDLYVIKYIDPAAPNHSALGLDLGSEPLRRAGVATAHAQLQALVALSDAQAAAPGTESVLADIAAATTAVISAARPGLSALLLALHETAEPRRDVATAALGKDSAVATLRALASQLGTSDMAAMRSLEQLQQQFGVALGPRMAPLQEAVDALDFERALLHCDTLINELLEGPTV